MSKVALITGITGQDGAYLSRLLLSKGYAVHGLRRRSSLLNTVRIAGLPITLHDGDMADASSIRRIVRAVQPDEVYNLAAMSDVHVSFAMPEYALAVNGLGVVHLLEALRGSKARFYQASTSEMFGDAPAPQNEKTPFRPRSPYAAAKVYAYHTTVNYREAYGLHASNGILFNHESPLRGEQFVTRKITKAVAAIVARRQDGLYLGNLDARRDWGHTRDFVDAMWRIVQDVPGDYVVATGESHTVREFVNAAFHFAGVAIKWIGHGVNEVGLDEQSRIVVAIDPALYRPTEVNHLCGDAKKIRGTLGWQPTVSFFDLVKEMVAADLLKEPK